MPGKKSSGSASRERLGPPAPIPGLKKYVPKPTVGGGYNPALVKAHKEFFTPPPTLKRTPLPGRTPEYGSIIATAPTGKLTPAEKKLDERLQREYEQKLNAWTRQRQKEWDDIRSGRAYAKERSDFLGKASKAVPKIPGSDISVPKSHPLYADAKRAAVDAEYQKLLKEWQFREQHPEEWAAKEAKRPKDLLGRISHAGISALDPLIPQSVSNDLQVLSAGLLPGIKQAGVAGFEFAKGDSTMIESMVTDTLNQYRENYLKHGWKGALSYIGKHPVFAGLDAAALLAPPLRVASIGKITRALIEANPGMEVSEAIRLATKESFRPGTAALAGREGGLSRAPLEGKSYSSNQVRPPSRSPIGRAGQRAYDSISRSIDQAPLIPGISQFGTSVRAARADQRAIRKALLRAQAGVAHLDAAVSDYVSTGGVSALAAEIRGRHSSDPGRAERLVSALEAGADPEKAIPERIAALQNVLDEGMLLKPTKNQEGLASGEKIAPVGGSPERARFQEVVTQALFETEENVKRYPDAKVRAEKVEGQVRSLTKVTDAIARASSPQQPSAWYAQRLAETTTGSAEEFMRSTAASAAQFQMAGPRRGLTGGEDPVFYSELQRHVSENVPERQKMQSMRARMQRAVSDVEYEQMGMDNFFDQYGPEEQIPKEDLQEFLSEPLNAYNLDEVVYSSNSSDYRARWQEYGGGVLMARKPTPDQPYHEIVMSLGAPHPRQRQNRLVPNRSSHWQEDDVVVHVRFHEITDAEGKSAILIDEIQSDWASDWRKRGSPAFTPETPQTRERVMALRNRSTQILEQTRAVDDARDALGAAQRRAWNAEADRDGWRGGDPAEIAELERVAEEARLAAIQAAEHERQVSNAAEALRGELDDIHTQLSDIRRETSHVPPPLGGKEVNAAVRRMMRWAHDTDHERIIVVPGEMQALRNGAYGRTPRGDTVDLQDYYGDDRSAWITGVRGLGHDELKAFGRNFKAVASGKAKTYFRLYEKDIPNALEKNMGAKGRFQDNIFRGYYGDQIGGIPEYGEGMVGGYVIDFTPEAMERAAMPMRLFQRQPDWNALPRGATEFLADGTTALRLFEGAGVDTVIHELAHIALPDLRPEERATIMRHYNNLTTEQDHEAFARAFEEYFRGGHSANIELQGAFRSIRFWMSKVWRSLHGKETLDPEVVQVFDNLVGRRPVENRRIQLDERETAMVKSQIAELEHALENPGDLETQHSAMVAMQALSQLVEDYGREILLHGDDGAPDEFGVTAADSVDTMLDRRRSAYTTLLREMGVTDETGHAGGYFPNLSIARTFSDVPIDPGKMAPTGNVIGTPKLNPDALTKKKNQFIRFQTGQVLMEPQILMHVLKLRMKALATLKQRQKLYDGGKPIKAGGVVEGQVYVRNPHATPTKIRDETKAALQMDEDRYASLVERGIPGEDPIASLEDMEAAPDTEMWWKGKKGADGKPEPAPEWIFDEPDVRTVPHNVAKALMGEVFSTGTRSFPLLAAGNAMARMAMLYAPGPIPGSRYVLRNAAQNAVLLGLTHPGAFKDVLRGTWRLNEHPDIRDMIDAEAGSTRALAGMPDHYVQAKTWSDRRERDVTRTQGWIGEKLSSVADNPFRRSLWIGYAKKYGFSEPEDWRRLLTSDDEAIARTRDLISQRVRDDLIDFDALSPFERNVLSRYFFLYPFMRGSLKWPFMFAREYPGRAGALGALAQVEGAQRNEEALAKTSGEAGKTGGPGGKQYEWGWLDPLGPSNDSIRMLTNAAQGLSRGDLKSLAQILSPELRVGVQSLSGSGNKNRFYGALAESFVPGLSTLRKARQGGSLPDQLLRHMGLSVEPGPARQLARKKDYADATAAAAYYVANGTQIDAATAAQIKKSLDAYNKYKDLDARIGFAAEDLGLGGVPVGDLSPEQELSRQRTKAIALVIAAAEGFPEKREALLASLPGLKKSTDVAAIKAYSELVQEFAFGPRNTLINGWKRATGG